MKKSMLLFAAALAILGGCKKKTAAAPDTTSSVTGALTVASFPSTPSAIEAVDEKGTTVQAAVDEQGRFQLSLPAGHTYRFAVALAAGSEPLVFPRASKRLDTTVHIATGAATVALGAVRHFNAAPADGFTVKSSSGSSPTKPQTETSGDGNVGECVDGFVKGTGSPCADDDAKASCDNGEGQNDNGADGECENGKDKKTGAACTDEQGGDTETNDDAASDADPTKPMAVPDHNAPDDVSGCNEGGDGESNDGEDQAD